MSDIGSHVSSHRVTKLARYWYSCSVPKTVLTHCYEYCYNCLCCCCLQLSITFIHSSSVNHHKRNTSGDFLTENDSASSVGTSVSRSKKSELYFHTYNDSILLIDQMNSLMVILLVHMVITLPMVPFLPTLGCMERNIHEVLLLDQVLDLG